MKFETFQIEYQLYGEKGPLLVLLNAQGTSMDAWPASFIHDMARFSRVLAYNRVGYGKSVRYGIEPKYISARSVSDDLLTLLKYLNCPGPIIFVGHSIGGLYSVYFAQNHPNWVAGIILIDAASIYEPENTFKSKKEPQPGTTNYLESEGFNQSKEEIKHSPPFPNIPVLIVTATDHKMSPELEKLWQQVQHTLAKISPQAKQVIIPHCGHFMFDDCPSELLEAIHSFVDNF